MTFPFGWWWIGLYVILGGFGLVVLAYSIGGEIVRDLLDRTPTPDELLDRVRRAGGGR